MSPPGARTLFCGKLLKIHSAAIRGVDAEPGKVYLTPEGGMCVGCGEGSLQLLSVQPEAGRTMSAEAFIRGYGPVEGEECRRT